MAVATVQTSALTEVTMDNLEEQLVESGKSLRKATLALTACFSVSASSISEFVELRSGCVDDAQVYRQKVLPLALASTQAVKEFMEYYEGLSFEEVMEVAPELADQAKLNHALMEINKDTHTEMAAAFKMKGAQVDKVLLKCQVEQKNYEEQAAILRQSAEKKNGWAIALAFIPVVNAIACPLLSDSAGEDLAKAVANEEEAQLAVNASHCVKDVLVSAIENYMSSMEILASTFQLLASECQSFANKSDKLAESRKKPFYLLLNKTAGKILSACDKSMVHLTNAESDLKSLPTASTPNYVQEWMATRRKTPGAPTFKDRVLGLGTGAPKCVKDAV